MSKIDFKKKMGRMSDNNKTVIGPTSPNNVVVAPKQDLNMTAPIHSEQVKNGRKLNDLGSPVVNKVRENSVDYNTIQPGRVTKQIPQYPQNDRIAAYQRRA